MIVRSYGLLKQLSGLVIRKYIPTAQSAFVLSAVAQHKVALKG